MIDLPLLWAMGINAPDEAARRAALVDRMFQGLAAKDSTAEDPREIVVDKLADWLIETVQMWPIGTLTLSDDKTSLSVDMKPIAQLLGIIE